MANEMSFSIIPYRPKQEGKKKTKNKKTFFIIWYKFIHKLKYIEKHSHLNGVLLCPNIWFILIVIQYLTT